MRVTETHLSLVKSDLPLTKIEGLDDTVKLLRHYWDANLINIQEQFVVVCLNSSNEVVAFRCLHTGMIDKIHIDIRLLMSIACISLSTSIIVAHNHPSGKLQPSRSDDNITRSIKKALEFVDIVLLDHIILTEKEHYSYAVECKI